jgi:hypothetical protein
MDSRFDADPTECAMTGGHYWCWDSVVIDTIPPIRTQYCTRCPAYREPTYGADMRQPTGWSGAKVHPRFQKRRPNSGRQYGDEVGPEPPVTDAPTAE